MANPKISIIIPVYNTSDYLKQCLDTVSNQTFNDIEIICVNDGSTDDSLKIINEYALGDDRFVVVSRDNASGSAALPRNIGLGLASGKYVMFLDSDDYFDLTMLEKLHNHAVATEADLVMCDSYTISDNTSVIYDNQSELHSEYLPKKKVFSYLDIPETIFQISNAAVWHKLVLHETLKKSGLVFQLNAPILDDIYFVNLLLVLSKRISIIPDKLVFYRYNRYESQTAGIERHKDSILKAFLALNEYLVLNSYYETVKISLQNWTLTMMAWWLHSIGNYQVFCELYDLYRNEYFSELNLVNIDTKTLYYGLERFYNSIMGEEQELSLKVIIESILTPGSRVAIYGAGRVGRKVHEIIETQKKHKTVIWCDKNAEKLSIELSTSLIKQPIELRSCSFDAIIIAIDNCDIIREVKSFISDIGLDSDKVFVVRNF